MLLVTGQCHFEVQLTLRKWVTRLLLHLKWSPEEVGNTSHDLVETSTQFQHLMVPLLKPFFQLLNVICAKKHRLQLVYLLMKAEKQDDNFKRHFIHVLIRHRAMTRNQPLLSGHSDAHRIII